MFCKKCGNEIEVDEKFCSQCGARSPSKNRSKGFSVDKKTPLLTAEPVFHPLVAIISIIPIQLFMTVWAGGFFGGFGLFGVQALDINIPPWFTFVFFGALAFFGIPILVFFVKKKTYAKTKYLFFADRLEYAEGFWTLENKTIKYKNITEANMRRGVVQKMYGLGTILLATPATGMQQGTSKSGIRILDIENTKKIYDKILDLIG